MTLTAHGYLLQRPAIALAMTALELYLKKGTSVGKGLAELAVSAMPFDVAMSRADAAMTSFGNEEGGMVILPDPLRGVTGDALSYFVREIEKVRKKQLALGIGDDETDERVEEAKTLAEAIGEQLVLALASGEEDAE